MHTIRSGRARNIEAIVYKQARRGTARDLHRPNSEIVKHSRRQRLLAYLEEWNLCGYDSLKKAQDVRSCLRRRRAARYRIGDRTWKVERHRLRTVFLSLSDSAKQRPCV